MNQEKALRKGKFEMRLIGWGLIALNLALSISEVFFRQNLILFIIQLVAGLLLSILLVAATLGRPVRWWLFIVLFLTSMLAFYLGGSRMSRYPVPTMSWEVFLAVGTALAYLLSALYLAYSSEIGLYLKRKNKVPED